MKIRNVRKKDIPRIGALLYQVHGVHAALRPDIFVPGQRKYDEAALEKLLEDPSRPMLAAVNEEDELVGYCLAEIQITSGESNLADRRVLYIDDICIDKASRGQGIGSALCEAALAYAREQKFDSVTLNVWEGNLEARRLYERMGFTPLKVMMERKP